MSITLKKIEEQVVVITGASSGIGLATAALAAERGASVVLAARSGETLKRLAENIKSNGGQAIAVTCDVTDSEQLSQLADVTIETFGRIDTWINNAGLGMWGRLDETDEQDARALFDVNFWGLVNGSIIALKHLRHGGGAIINVGSEVSDAYAPLQGMYSATKHAIKGFTDALRLEVEIVDRAPVSITLIQPTAVDTPFPQHARNFTDKEPMLPKPMIEPQQVAEVILNAAETPCRDETVGTMAFINTTVTKMMPSIGDQFAAKKIDKMHYDENPRNPEGALRQASESTGEAGRTHGSGGRQPK